MFFNNTKPYCLCNVRGYTLIELTVVVFLIGTMLALTIPRIQDSFLSDNLNGATRRFIGKVLELKEKAIKSGSGYELHLDIDSNMFWENKSASETPTDINDEVEESFEDKKEGRKEMPILDVELPGSGKKSAGEAIIHFTKNGYVEPAIVHLGTKADNARTIRLSPFIGIQETFDKYVDLETLAANDM